MYEWKKGDDGKYTYVPAISLYSDISEMPGATRRAFSLDLGDLCPAKAFSRKRLSNRLIAGEFGCTAAFSR